MLARLRKDRRAELGAHLAERVRVKVRNRDRRGGRPAVLSRPRRGLNRDVVRRRERSDLLLDRSHVPGAVEPAVAGRRARYVGVG